MTLEKAKKNIKQYYKQTLKYLLIFLVSFSGLTGIGYIKENYYHRELVEEKIHSFFTYWKGKDLGEIAKIAKTTPETFIIETGFENNEEIQQLIENHIYEDVTYEIKTISVDNWTNKIPQAKAKIKISTYNNLEVINQIIEELMHDETKIDMNYNFNDFLERNYNNIVEAVKGIQKDYIKTVIISFDYDSKNKVWTIPFDMNKEAFNTISGNMIEFNENVDVQMG